MDQTGVLAPPAQPGLGSDIAFEYRPCVAKSVELEGIRRVFFAQLGFQGPQSSPGPLMVIFTQRIGRDAEFSGIGTECRRLFERENHDVSRPGK